MGYTFPNQRTIIVHREKPTQDFLGIKNENWMAASRDLGAHALQLYLYLASNKDNYNLALSPAAITEQIGMARSTYHDQFKKLINKGYLVNVHGNTFDFYETPMPRDVNIQKNDMSTNEQIFVPCTSDGIEKPNFANNIYTQDIQINNIKNSTDNLEYISEIQKKRELEEEFNKMWFNF